MQDIKHYDILWVDDFDKNEQFDNPRRYLKDYFPSGFDFRVKIETNFFNALVHLENNFLNYSCVVLDVNFIKGFNIDDLNNDDAALSELCLLVKNKKVSFRNGEIVEFEKILRKEKKTINKAIMLCRLYEILGNNNILIDGAHDTKDLFCGEVIDYEKISKLVGNFEKEDNDFKKNAGYYLFLYLLQRGMPQNNIAMLTGNKGETSEKWNEKFNRANLTPPKAFDRVQCELTDKNSTSEFVDWLDGVFSSPYRLRACMIAMTTLLQKMLDDEDTKRKLVSSGFMWNKEKDDDRSYAVRNFHPEYIPFRLPEEEEKSVEILFHFISQVVAVWDKADDPRKRSSEEYPYFATMKTARNWLAHRIIKKLSLQTECFLFGVCMRGMFNFSKLDTQTLGDYKNWEKELLKLIEKLDAAYSPCVHGISSLVLSSSEELRFRSGYERIKSEYRFIRNLLNFIGQPTNSIKCYEEDLLRAFLHGVHGEIPSGYRPPGYARYVGNSGDIRIRYLEKVRNRLKQAINEAKNLNRKD